MKCAQEPGLFLEKGAGWVSLDRGGKQAKGGVYQRGKERKSGKAQEEHIIIQVCNRA